MAGATRIGFSKFQARQMHVNKLSHKPFDSFANVLALNLKVIKISAYIVNG